MVKSDGQGKGTVNWGDSLLKTTPEKLLRVVERVYQELYVEIAWCLELESNWMESEVNFSL